MSKSKLFLLSVLLTTGVMLVVYYVHRSKPRPTLVRIADNVFLTSQLRTESVPTLRRWNIKTVVDIRPDGEAQDQAPSAEIEAAAKASRMGFRYIPVPHDGIPDTAVKALDNALSAEAMPALLYCRTGRRAVRLYALVEASRVDGPGTGAILQMVRDAGFSADDLKDEINQRLARRSSVQPVNQ